MMSNFFSQIDLNKLGQKDYLFETFPQTNGLYLYLLILFGLLVILAGASIYFYRQPKYRIYRRYRSQLFNYFLIGGLVGLVIVGFRFEQIPYLGSRLIMSFWLLVLIGWGSWIIYFKFKVMPKIIKEEQAKEKFKKYLPKNERK